MPTPARVLPRTPGEVLEVAVALKQENPERTTTQIARVMRAQSGWAPSERTLQRHFVHWGLDREIAAAPPVFGRFEAERCNELRVGDVLHGPVITGGRKTYLFAFLDDRITCRTRLPVRLLRGHRPAGRGAAPRAGLPGVPGSIYVDNGALFACLPLGQPTLRRRVKLGVLAALDQRIAVRY